MIVHPSDELYGIDRVLLSVVDALRAQADVEVWIPTDISYPKRPLSNELIKRGVTARGLDLPVLRRPHLTPTGTWYTLRRIRLSIQLVRRDRPSLMWVNGTAMTPLLVTAWVTRTPAVLHVHEILEPHERCLLAPLLRTANTVIAVSEATRRALPKSVRSRAVVVPNAVSGPTVPPKLRTAGPVRVLFAGRWTPRKGVAELIFAWRSVKRTDLVLTILGGPPPPPAVGIDVVTLARGTRGVTIVGEVRDVRPYLTECDVVVVPSTLPESSGLVVAEAASMARPAIASAMGGLTELVRDGVTGWLVPAGDASALANVLARLDRTELHRRGRAARKEWEERWPQHTFSDLLRGLPTSLVPPRKSTRVSAKVRIDDSVSG